MHYALATLDKATHPKPLVKTLATHIWTFRYRKMRCCRWGPVVVNSDSNSFVVVTIVTAAVVT